MPMTAHEWLMRYRDCMARWDSLNDELEQVRSRAVRSGTLLGDMPGGQGRPSDHPADAAERMDGYRHQLDTNRAEIERIRTEVQAAIDAVPNGTQRKVLRYFYINGFSIRVIAEHMHYGERQVRRLKAKGLRAVEGAKKDVL